MRRHAAMLSDVAIIDATSEYAQINVHGPLSRDLLAAVTDTDLSNEAFAFRRCSTHRGRRSARALRADHLRR